MLLGVEKYEVLLTRKSIAMGELCFLSCLPSAVLTHKEEREESLWKLHERNGKLSGYAWALFSSGYIDGLSLSCSFLLVCGGVRERKKFQKKGENVDAFRGEGIPQKIDWKESMTRIACLFIKKKKI